MPNTAKAGTGIHASIKPGPRYRGYERRSAVDWGSPVFCQRRTRDQRRERRPEYAGSAQHYPS